MTERESKEMKITVDISTGNFVEAVDEKGAKATPVDAEELKKSMKAKMGLSMSP